MGIGILFWILKLPDSMLGKGAAFQNIWGDDAQNIQEGI